MENNTLENDTLENMSNAEIVAAMQSILASPYQNWLSTWGKNIAFKRYAEELYRRAYSGKIPEWRYGPR